MIKEYDVVALINETQAVHKETKQLILLRPGQVGTVLMSFDQACLIDFADVQGETYAVETIPATHLMLLNHEPVLIES